MTSECRISLTILYVGDEQGDGKLERLVVPSSLYAEFTVQLRRDGR